MIEKHNLLDRFYVQKFKPEEIVNKIDMIFIYALMWSLAGTVDEKGRDIFHKFFKISIREP